MFCGSLDGRGVWGRVDACVCLAESLRRVPETITALSIRYTPTQTKKFKSALPTAHKPAPSLSSCQFLGGTIDYSAWIRHPGSILNPPSAAPTISVDPHPAPPSIHTLLSRSCPGPRGLTLGPLTSLLNERLPHCPQAILLPEG